jgi:hypothetical protein
MSQTIEIIIAPDGQSRLETKGFAGGQCRQASRFLESALGRTTAESLTAEFHETHARQENNLDQET